MGMRPALVHAQQHRIPAFSTDTTSLLVLAGYLVEITADTGSQAIVNQSDDRTGICPEKETFKNSFHAQKKLRDCSRSRGVDKPPTDDRRGL